MKPAFFGGGGRQRTKHGGIEPVDADSPIRRSRPIRWLIGCGALLVAAIAVGTCLTIVHFRERALANAERELESTALVLARHFDQQFEQLELVEKQIAQHIRLAGIVTPEDFRRAMSDADIHLMLGSKIDALPHVGNLSLADSEGRLINSARAWPVPSVSVADRAHFKALKANPQLTTAMSEPVFSHSTGAWTTILARSLTGPNGEFLGAALGGIELVQFEYFFASMARGDGSAIALIREDGTLLARYPHIDEMIGRKFSNGPVRRTLLASGAHGIFRSKSPIDGLERIGAARKLDGYPIFISASATVSAALAAWWDQMRFLIALACVSALTIALVVFLIVRRLSLEHHRSKQGLKQQKQRLDIALDNMTQGLVMLDASNRIVVCNQRYIEMYGLSPQIVRPGCSFADLMVHRQQIGTFTGDIATYCSSILADMALGRVSKLVAQSVDDRYFHIVTRPTGNGGWVATHEDITERKRSDRRIAHLAHYDALTDLPNRVQFREQLDCALGTIAGDERLAVLYIDIDEFKSVNDSLGHQVGDELLKAVADRLRGCLGETDFVARLGGDEFAIVHALLEKSAETTKLVEKIYRAIRQPLDCAGHLVTTDASIGIAIAPQDGSDLDRLLKHADLAMYAAKADGRRTYRFFEPGMDARVTALRTLELDLRRALAEGGFELNYQPLVNLADGRVNGGEALLRWRHAARGMVSPAEFIPVAEETGLINQLGEWVLTTACADAASWPDDVKVAVNVSPVQFRSQGFALKVAAALAASGLAAHRLELEITEAVLIRDDEAALAMLHQLRELGVRIALDDFGTGYSSLAYLQQFPFDKIKIDRCFIKDVACSDVSSCIVQAVVNIAAVRQMTTTAEGVETGQQRDMLRHLGCTEMQGFLFSPAIPTSEIRRLLASRDKVAGAA
jgi:diguanylate cyclase (GGDEF)-like protein